MFCCGNACLRRSFTGSGLSSSSQFFLADTHLIKSHQSLFMQWDTNTEIQEQIYFHVFEIQRCWVILILGSDVLHLLLIQWVCLEFHSLLQNIGKHRGRVTETRLLIYWNRREGRKVWSVSLFHTHTHTVGSCRTVCICGILRKTSYQLL